MNRRLAWLLAAALLAGPVAANAAVTRIVIAPPALTGSVACPVQQIFVAQITSTRPGSVRFRWTTSDGQHSPVQDAIFTSPGARPVSYLWMARSHRPHVSGWVRVATLAPDGMTATAKVSVSCRPS